MKKPIVWTIAGSDSGAGAGIQADLKAAYELGVHGATILTSLTAQNSVRVTGVECPPTRFIIEQWDALSNDLPAKAIKLGMLANQEVGKTLARLIETINAPVVIDPVLVASSGDVLSKDNIESVYLNELIPKATLVTPNVLEAQKLSGVSITNETDFARVARFFLEKGAKAALIKGGDMSHSLTHSTDYFTDGSRSFFLRNERLPHGAHGTGCTLSSAVACFLALGESLQDAVVGAKAFVYQSLRRSEAIGGGFRFLNSLRWEQNIKASDLPVVPTWEAKAPLPFPELTQPIGFYPIVDSYLWVERLVEMGVKTIQLRIKDPGPNYETEIERSINLCQSLGIQLFINDDWELAIRHGAYGVHLGQEDLLSADLAVIHQSGVRLGLSTHSYYEMAVAKGLKPSYIAIGPIFPTSLKTMAFAPQGLDRLLTWKQFWDIPVVAIGGINYERARTLVEKGVTNLSVVSAITQALNVKDEIQRWRALIEPNLLC